MIEKMQKIFIYGLSDDASRMMRDVMRAGCMQVTDPASLAELPDANSFVDKRDSELYDWEQRLGRVSAAIATLLPYTKQGGLFTPRPQLSFAQLEDSAAVTEALAVCDSVEAAQRELAELRSALGRLSFTRDSLAPWGGYRVPLGETETRTCRLQLFTLPFGVSLEDLDTELAEAGVAAGMSLISSDKDQHYIAFIAHRDHFAAAEELVRQRGASRVSFNELVGTVAVETKRLADEIAVLEASIAKGEQALQSLGEQAKLLKQVYDSVQTTIDCKRSEQKLLHTAKTCLVAAWMPKNKQSKVEKLLSGYTCCYEITDPAPDEDTPVLLKNNRWIAPFESVTQMYSLPSSGGIDPDPFMAPFFFVFFGMMLSDAGYGIILTIGGLLGAKLMGGNKLLKMLGYCGISTIFWGVLYGSFFGDAITQVMRTFFGVEFTMPALIDPLKDPMTILILSFVLGALHLFVGMGINAYLMVKRGHPWAALFDVGSWYFVLIGLVMMVAGGTMGQVGMYMAIGGAVTLVLTQGRDKKNPLLKLASGLLSLYNITGYFSDVLSYSRIMALGLATGVIASVVNTMGTMIGPSIIGVIAFVAIFAFGHLLNFAINALGSFVHTSRLQYVEFFGKFFEGGGQGFAPLRANTKYVNINNQEDK